MVGENVKNACGLVAIVGVTSMISNDSMDNMDTIDTELDENTVIKREIESELQKLCIFTDIEKDIILGLLEDG